MVFRHHGPHLGHHERRKHRQARHDGEREHDERHALSERRGRPTAAQMSERQEERRPHVHEAQEVVEQADGMDVQRLHSVKLERHQKERHQSRVGKREQHERHDARGAREDGALVFGKQPPPREARHGVVSELYGEVNEQDDRSRFIMRVRNEVAECAPQDARRTEEEAEHRPHARSGANLRGPVKRGDLRKTSRTM